AQVRTEAVDGLAPAPGSFRMFREWRQGIAVIGRLLHEKDAHIGNIERDLAAVSRAATERDATIRERDGRIEQLVREGLERTAELAEWRSAAERDRRTNAELEARVGAQEQRLRALQEALDRIQSGVAYSALERFWTWNAN